MTKREKIREMRLAEIEEEFRELLLSCLRQCAAGRWGLFGQNDHIDNYELYYGWPEAKRLRGLAQELRSIQIEFGQANKTCELFLELCALRGQNVPGEPKLAAEFLAKIVQS
jgi:hypothetical protein